MWGEADPIIARRRHANCCRRRSPHDPPSHPTHHLSPFPRSDWALVFGGVATAMSLLPNFRNFRLFCFIALVATTFTAWVS